jgi:hypothetical protein
MQIVAVNQNAKLVIPARVYGVLGVGVPGVMVGPEVDPSGRGVVVVGALMEDWGHI